MNLTVKQRLAKGLVKLALWLNPYLSQRARIGDDTHYNVIVLDQLFADDDRRTRERQRERLLHQP